jgi:hypothetical protein
VDESQPHPAGAEHRVALLQRTDAIERLLERRQFRGVARARRDDALHELDVTGINSCSGGSSRRMVTGSPSIASNMPSKSSCCSGFDREDRDQLGRRAPLLGMFPLRIWHKVHERSRQP